MKHSILFLIVGLTVGHKKSLTAFELGQWCLSDVRDENTPVSFSEWSNCMDTNTGGDLEMNLIKNRNASLTYNFWTL